MDEDFKEIAHSGGTITFTFTIDSNNRVTCQTNYTQSRPNPLAVISLYATPEGIPIGINKDWFNDQGPTGCWEVLISSDSKGKFGHNCPGCHGYWRSGPFPVICPYCGIRGKPHNFLSHAQQRYVKHYCSQIMLGFSEVKEQEFVIDMDSVADAVDTAAERPSFYVSDEKQQHEFICSACNEYNDILGYFGYCSLCGTRNNFHVFKNEKISKIREALKSENSYEDLVRDAVSSFDTLVGDYATQLVVMVPLSEKRKKRLKKRFHDIIDVVKVFNEYFDIDLFKNIKKESDQKFLNMMFHRRHLYEHKGGVVDDKYLEKSGDTSVRLKQRIKETKDNVIELLKLLPKLAKSLHDGFHELIPPEAGPIDYFNKKTRS
jgi:hypothetical protein